MINACIFLPSNTLPLVKKRDYNFYLSFRFVQFLTLPNKKFNDHPANIPLWAEFFHESLSSANAQLLQASLHQVGESVTIRIQCRIPTDLLVLTSERSSIECNTSTTADAVISLEFHHPLSFVKRFAKSLKSRLNHVHFTGYQLTIHSLNFA